MESVFRTCIIAKDVYIHYVIINKLLVWVVLDSIFLNKVLDSSFVDEKNVMKNRNHTKYDPSHLSTEINHK